jgi:D-alanine-D-alanine ligase
MSNTPDELARYVLRPTTNEIRSTHVLFHTKHATDLTDERRRRFGYTVVYHAAILEALQKLGLKVTPSSDPDTLLQNMDIDFIWFTQIEEPFLGHELFVPCLAAYSGVSFLGPAAPVRALSEDKVLGKALAASLGIDVAEHRVVKPFSREIAELSLPGRWILKPRTGVMSEHLSLLEDDASWRQALNDAANPRHAGRDFIVEEFVPGLNLTVPVIEGFPPQAFPVFIEKGEPANNILTEAGKEGQSRDYASEPYSGPGAAEASEAATRFAAAISPFDYARFDFRFDPQQGRLVFLEVNMNCAMGPAAVVTRAAGMRGVDFQTLVGHVFAHSVRRQG